MESTKDNALTGYAITKYLIMQHNADGHYSNSISTSHKEDGKQVLTQLALPWRARAVVGGDKHKK